MMTRLAIVVVAVVNALPATAAPGKTSSGTARAEPASVGRVVIAGGVATLSARVATGGCTRADDFHVATTKERDRQVVTIVRDRVDTCEMFALDGTVVELTTKDLVADQPIAIANPLFVSPRK